jgi:hypothetical protein
MRTRGERYEKIQWNGFFLLNATPRIMIDLTVSPMETLGDYLIVTS